MKLHLLHGASLISISALALVAQAADYPSGGMVYNTKEVSSMTYSCQLIEGDRVMECEFNQSSVRRKGKPEDLTEKLRQARTEFHQKGGSVVTPEECKNYTQMYEALEGKRKVPKQAALDSMSSKEKQDLKLGMKHMMAFCADKSETNLLNIVRYDHDRTMRTCSVSSNSFKQIFERKNAIAPGKPPVWAVRSESVGECGIVQLSRFEPEIPEGSKTVFWHYIARKAVTNPKAKLLGMSCGELDQSEYHYDWRSKEHLSGCDVIQFSPL
jgi:hypothetical protein